MLRQVSFISPQLHRTSSRNAQLSVRAEEQDDVKGRNGVFQELIERVASSSLGLHEKPRWTQRRNVRDHVFGYMSPHERFTLTFYKLGAKRGVRIPLTDAKAN